MGIPRGNVKLLRIVDRAVAGASSRAGSHLVCRPGRTPCRFGPFAITALDAWRLRRGLAELVDIEHARAALDVSDLEDALADELTLRSEGGDTIVAAVLAEGPGARRDGGGT